MILKKLEEKRKTPEHKLKQKESNKKWYIKHYKEYRAKNLERIKSRDRARKKIRWADDPVYKEKCKKAYKKWKEKNTEHLKNYFKGYDKNRTIEQRKAHYEAMKKR